MPDEKKTECPYCGKKLGRHTEEKCPENPMNQDIETPESLEEEVLDQLSSDATTAALLEEVDVEIAVKPGVIPKLTAPVAPNPDEMVRVTLHPAFPAAQHFCEEKGFDWYTTKHIRVPGTRGQEYREKTTARSRVSATISRKEYDALQKAQKGCVRLGH